MSSNKITVVLGAYGLIGAACVRALRQAGFHVVGVGRSETTARRVLPDLEWRILDLARASSDDLKRAVADADVVINAAGALQDGPKDDVAAIHETMIARLVTALEGSQARIIQISAAGVSPSATTEFTARWCGIRRIDLICFRSIAPNQQLPIPSSHADRMIFSMAAAASTSPPFFFRCRSTSTTI